MIDQSERDRRKLAKLTPFRNPNTEAKAWEAFKQARDNPALAPCPFCGIRHTPSKWHPFCDMVVTFRVLSL